jgi:hypothetical protein
MAAPHTPDVSFPGFTVTLCVWQNPDNKDQVDQTGPESSPFWLSRTGSCQLVLGRMRPEGRQPECLAKLSSRDARRRCCYQLTSLCDRCSSSNYWPRKEIISQKATERKLSCIKPTFPNKVCGTSRLVGQLLWLISTACSFVRYFCIK